MPKRKLRLIQRLTDEFIRLRSKTVRDPRTKADVLVRHRFRRVENIMRKRYGDIYALALLNMGKTIIDEKGEEHDLLQLQRKWISKAKLGKRTIH
tara:strand:+ start:1233 stop:1517 length:285 start_codon:yes stop_codon:yes gene_type:complete